MLCRLAAGSAIAMITCGTASAADLDGNCCEDLEERVAELEQTMVRKGNRKVSLEVSGHVNEAILYWHDGTKQATYIGTPVNSRTRFRFKGSAKINADWAAGFLIEVGLRYNNLAAVDQIDGTVNTGLDIRHQALYVKSKSLGTVWLGWTGSASDGIAEIYLGGNLETPYPLLSGGGLKLRDNATGALTTISLINAAGIQGEFKQGEGNRRNILRYISPTLAGFVVSAGVDGNGFWDASLKYAGEFGQFRIAGGIGYQESTDENDPIGMFTRCAVNGRVDCTAVGASGGIMHVPTGLYANASYGYIKQNNSVTANDRDEHWAVYTGVVQKWISLGKTNLWGSYGETTSEIARIGGLDAFSIGVNQNIYAAALELYLTYRRLEARDETNDASLDVDLVQFGARIKF
jgi:predicted porin